MLHRAGLRAKASAMRPDALFALLGSRPLARLPYYAIILTIKEL
jgi:hypothetical protein